MTASTNRTSLASSMKKGLAKLISLGAIAILRSSLPARKGKSTLPGLKGNVEIVWDHWGVPHIYAINNHDLFFAQGYVHALDRLWQMEFQRRLGHGKLSEVFGSRTLTLDRFSRTLGFGTIAQQEVEKLPYETRAVIHAYVNGINAYIRQIRHQSPIEFKLLHLRPEPWKENDVLVLGKIFALNLSENWTKEFLRGKILAAVGTERAEQLEPRKGKTLSPDDEKYWLFSKGISPISGLPNLITENGIGKGSNAWVVGSAHTAESKPILANDPHLPLQIPSTWYENHLVGGDYHVTGVSLPGAPGVIIGHTDQIAWGITNSMVDTQDIFLEKFDPEDIVRYRFKDNWKQAEVRREEIRIRGQHTPHVEEVRITRHGPIMDAFLPAELQDNADTVISFALQWTALQPGDLQSAILKMNMAHDWESFLAAVAHWTSPSQNFVYADVDDNIGEVLGGDIPFRTRGDGRLPVPGWTGEYEWVGIMPHTELPHLLNPDTGFIVSANNQLNVPSEISAEWDVGYRAKRIHELLQQQTTHTIATTATIQRDQLSLSGLLLVQLVASLPPQLGIAEEARQILLSWNGEVNSDSIGATIYAYFIDNLTEEAYDEIGFLLKKIVIGPGAVPGMSYLQHAVPDILQRASLREDNWLPEGRQWDDIINKAWDTSIVEIQQLYGDDITQWHYGRWHQLTLRHLLGAGFFLDAVFNRGAFATGGDINTVCMGYIPRQTGRTAAYVGPSYRQICNLANWGQSVSMHVPGQSGHLASKHYDDLLPLWLDCEYHPMPWERPQVEGIMKSRQILTAVSRNFIC
ncbi:peptidase S45 [Reticulibacter mediterranei]|uniref:Peptidase S45 n=1 Tax=Reticulibacter mediterranei TaxID=2778369 RepID=A0A8J3IVG3_9CHLR|nr:penicillin acylase family protein [Reticulibacter mediterranei]GHO97482.1 peptidase S45 [Reticulibacter mediterranei]